MNLQVTGQLTGIEARNGGWFAVAIQEPGRDWPLKVSTKRTALVQEAQQLMGQQVSAVYTEQESTNINPNSGMPYINRYLEGVSLAGQQPQQSMPVQQPQPGPQTYQQQPVMQQPVMQQQPQPQQPLPQPGQTQTLTHVVRDDAARELKIHRQSAAKVAVQLLPHVLDEGEKPSLSGLLRLSEALVRYFNEGVQWKVEPPSAGANPGGGVPSGDQSGASLDEGDPGRQIGDPGIPIGDDIPF